MTRIVRVLYVDGSSEDYDLDTDDLDAFLDDLFNLEEGEDVQIEVLKVEEDEDEE